MIIEYKNGRLTATAENLADVQFILSLPSKRTSVLAGEGEPVVREKYKHYKKNKIVLCSECAKPCKGKQGIAIHNTRYHKGTYWRTRGEDKRGETGISIEQTMEPSSRPIGERTYPTYPDR